MGKHPQKKWLQPWRVRAFGGITGHNPACLRTTVLSQVDYLPSDHPGSLHTWDRGKSRLDWQMKWGRVRLYARRIRMEPNRVPHSR